MVEIERKFLVGIEDVDALERDADKALKIAQGYVLVGEGKEVRVRRSTSLPPAGRGETECVLTVKAGGALERVEVEVPIEEHEAEALLSLTEGRLVRKTRYVLGRWEVDVYSGFGGLTVAEVELESAEEPPPPPPPHISLLKDVTFDARYKNRHLAGISEGVSWWKKIRRFGFSVRQACLRWWLLRKPIS